MYFINQPVTLYFIELWILFSRVKRVVYKVNALKISLKFDEVLSPLSHSNNYSIAPDNFPNSSEYPYPIKIAKSTSH